MQAERGVVRWQYLSAIWLPLLIAVITADTTLFAAIPLFAGWTLLAVGANVLNDYFDDDRALPVDRTGLLILYSVATVLGIILLLDAAMAALLFVAVTAVYNRWFTTSLYGALFHGLIFALPVLPLTTRPATVAAVFLLGVSVDTIHRACDGDHGHTPRQALLVLAATGIAGAAAVVRLVTVAPAHSYLLPFALYFLASPLVLHEYRSAAGKTAMIAAGLLTTVYLIGVAATVGALF